MNRTIRNTQEETNMNLHDIARFGRPGPDELVPSRYALKVGEIVTAKIERADQYDLHGSVAGF